MGTTVYTGCTACCGGSCSACGTAPASATCQFTSDCIGTATFTVTGSGGSYSGTATTSGGESITVGYDGTTCMLTVQCSGGPISISTIATCSPFYVTASGSGPPGCCTGHDSWTATITE